MRGGLAPWQVKRTCEAMAATLDLGEEDVGAAELAAMVGLSPNHFRRAFAQSTGLPPHRWITALRLERAKALLGDPRLGLTEIALALGFAGQSAFGRFFQRETGFTPSAFQRQTRT